jgi:translation initiation factor 1
VRIRLDRRASSRLVTVVTGLPPGKELADLIRALKAACGAGGTLKEGALELQGDHREKVESALTDRRISWKRAGG